ncbi:hypothetical protein MLD52_21610 [Puniceicoccaceae bacterium K14]|nr:hypothetical protein [Puniceicoccaceae bacterium K14]
MKAIEGMDADTIRRYAEARKKVDENADLIICITSVFSVFEEWPDDRIAISPFALGKLNDLMSLYSCRILSAWRTLLPCEMQKTSLRN